MKGGPMTERPMTERAMTESPLAADRPRLLDFDWLLWLVASGGVLLLAAVLEFRPPRTIVVPILDLHLPQMCSAQRMFSIDCPGCGLTRSFVLAAHGELGQAFAVHPVGTLFFILLVLQIPWRLWQGLQTYRRRRVWRSGRLEWGTGAILLFAAFLWWTLKSTGLVDALAG